MRLYNTECPFDWAMGIVQLPGFPGECDATSLLYKFASVTCMETQLPLPAEVVFLAAAIQSGLPKEGDHKAFLLNYPEGPVKEKLKSHLDEMRQSRWWNSGLWKGYLRSH